MSSGSGNAQTSGKMQFDNEEINYYEVIGCSVESSIEEIGRAVRKLSVKYHPDKNKAPEAAEIFLKIQKCKEFLLDEEKRKEYDEKYKKIAKRKEYDAKRYQNMDSRRKRMREELEARLGSAQKPSTSQSNASASSDNSTQSEKRRKKAELDRIRKDGLERVRAAATKQQQQDHSDTIEEISKKLRAREDEQARVAAQAAATVEEEVYLQIKVKWKRSAESHSDDTLAALFREFGAIEEISLLPGKGASAVITFSDPSAAPAAVKAYEASKVFRVTIYGEPKKASIFTHVYSSSTQNSASSTSNVGAAHFSNNAFVESDLMREVRRTMEREALLRELHDEEGYVGGTTTSGRNEAQPTSPRAHAMPFVPSKAEGVHFTYRGRDMPHGGGISYAELKVKEDDVFSKIFQMTPGKNSIKV